MTQPFGGYKQSGNARDKCFDSLQELHADEVGLVPAQGRVSVAERARPLGAPRRGRAHHARPAREAERDRRPVHRGARRGARSRRGATTRCARSSSRARGALLGRLRPRHGRRRGQPRRADVRRALESDFRIILRFWDSPKPTIAAVHGYCLGSAHGARARLRPHDRGRGLPLRRAGGEVRQRHRRAAPALARGPEGREVAAAHRRRPRERGRALAMGS